MVEGHRAVFGAAWNECAVVRAYLEAVEGERLRRSGVGTPRPVARRWCAGDSRRVRADLFAGLTLDGHVTGVTETDLAALEDRFVAVAYHYGARRGICYGAWRAVGVHPTVLRRAGITAPS